MAAIVDGLIDPKKINSIQFPLGDGEVEIRKRVITMGRWGLERAMRLVRCVRSLEVSHLHNNVLVYR